MGAGRPFDTMYITLKLEELIAVVATLIIKVIDNLIYIIKFFETTLDKILFET